MASSALQLLTPPLQHSSPPTPFQPHRLQLRASIRKTRHGRIFNKPMFRCNFQKKPLINEEERRGKDVYEFERLFSNLNQATLQREPGSLTSAVLLVAGTTVGAGILAIPAVTQEAGFLASAVTCVGCWVFMVVTGLLIAEVNVKTMCELGSGGVSLVSMARRTLGSAGVQVAW